MTNKILSTREGQAGVITLNRPEAINALDLEMIDAISAAQEEFLADDDIKLVLFEGNGPRGFCAGGDMRAIRQQVLEGDLRSPEAFFTREYAMNLRLAEAAKPIVALTHGVIMGGGVGIAGHANFRFSVADCRFAMPEAAIGFHCDVGANALLAKAEPNKALAFCMTGDAVGADAALNLGLTDCAIDPAARAEIRAGIVAAATGEDVRATLTRLMQGHSIVPEATGFGDMADRMAAAFEGQSAAEIVAELTRLAPDDAVAGKMLASVQHRCPTSLEVIYQTLMAARAEMDLATILTREIRLSVWMIARHDFAEGVRSVLVDKDRNPNWRPDSPQSVNIAEIGKLVSG